MSDLPDWEERCLLAIEELDRTDLTDAQKVGRVRQILVGQVDEDGTRAHVWVEVGMDPIPGTSSASPGSRLQYRCRNCGAQGYRMVFPTSVTLYPIVSDAQSCSVQKE